MMIEGTNVCYLCKKSKPMGSFIFSVKGKDNRGRYCKECRMACSDVNREKTRERYYRNLGKSVVDPHERFMSMLYKRLKDIKQFSIMVTDDKVDEDKMGGSFRIVWKKKVKRYKGES
jgi:hypothetical protein